MVMQSWSSELAQQYLAETLHAVFLSIGSLMLIAAEVVFDQYFDGYGLPRLSQCVSKENSLNFAICSNIGRSLLYANHLLLPLFFTRLDSSAVAFIFPPLSSPA